MWCRRAALAHSRTLLISSIKAQCLPPSLPYSDIPGKKGKLAPLQERRMVDRFRLWAKGGEGGNGCWSYQRSRTDRHGKPDGGNGGRGGDVFLECSAAVWDFSNLQHHLNAKGGGHGVSKNKIGSRGSDKVVQVPVGTVIHLVSGEIPSFVERKSVTSLQPWEIPDSDEVESSKFNEAMSTSVRRMAQDSGKLDKDNIELSLHVKNITEKSGHGDHLQMQLSSSNGAEWENDFLSCSEDNRSEFEDIESYMSVPESETEFEDEQEEEEEEVIQHSVAELTEPGQRVLVACGGEGGLGNASISRTHRKIKRKDNGHNPEISDDEYQFSLLSGVPGSEAVLILELKRIADVGLVGMPNAGKSTLLGAISRAKPSVGHYAFTTLRPNIGNLNYEDFFSVSVADIPGIIKGAHENRGLGHAFLRHIERTKVLAYVVDLAAGLDGRKGIPPWEQLRDLVLELEYHREGLSDRPSLIVANKIDEKGAENAYEELKRRVHGVPIFPICAVLEEGILELKAGLRRLMDGKESQRLKLDEIIIS